LVAIKFDSFKKITAHLVKANTKTRGGCLASVNSVAALASCSAPRRFRIPLGLFDSRFVVGRHGNAVFFLATLRLCAFALKMFSPRA
jgi:hypothetical protein